METLRDMLIRMLREHLDRKAKADNKSNNLEKSATETRAETGNKFTSGGRLQ
jgi:hypothetical protein